MPFSDASNNPSTHRKLVHTHDPLTSRHDTPGTNLVVSVSSKQSLSIRAPCQAHTFWVSALLANLDVLWLQLIHLALLLQVEDDDAAGRGCAQPVSIWRENEGVDLIASSEGIKVLGLVQVPKHGGSILSTGRAEGSIWGDGNGVDVAGVSDVVGLEFAGGKFPDLLRFFVSGLLSWLA
jgi:hypothetical protein